MPTEHYFSENPAGEDDPRQFTVRLLGHPLTFKTNAGVFSKERVDPGSRLLIESVELPPAGDVLDLGAGYGPIGLAVAKARPDLRVYLVELNRRAVELAVENARANGLENVTVYQGDGLSAVPEPETFALVLTNPPFRAGKATVHAWVEGSRERLGHDGTLVCVGRTKQGVKSLATHMESVFGNVRVLAKGGGYRVVASTKRR